MKKFTLLSAVLACGLYATEIYTVDDLTIKALENAPDLKISSYNYDASKSRYDGAFSNYLPSVDLYLSAGTGKMNDIQTVNPDTMIQNNTMLGSLSVKQIIYDFGKTGGNSDSFKYEEEAYSNQYKQSISDKKRDVKTAYFNVLQALALINVHKENVKLNEIQLYRSQKYFTAGIRTKIDISDAKVELIKAKLELKKTEYDLKLSYTKLDKVIGFKEVKNDYRVYSKELNFNTLYSSLTSYPILMQEAVNYAYENRELIKEKETLIKSAEAINDVASSEYYPSIYLNADYTQQISDKQRAQEERTVIPEVRYKATVDLSWNIYQGGSTDALTQEKIINKQISESNLAYSKLSIKTEVTQAYITMFKMRDSVELSQSLLEVSNEKFDQAGKRYENGLSDFIELQQARQGYIDAMASLVIDYYSYYSAIATLDNAIGK